VNGVIHIIDGVLTLPSPVFELLDSHPTVFSTFNLALDRTRLHHDLSQDQSVVGGTWFVPSNDAWLELGPSMTAFLFSPDGLIYLRALLDYHIAPYWTLFSNGIYPLVGGNDETIASHQPDERIQVELPTLRGNHTLIIDLASRDRRSEIRINTYDTVSTSDIFTANAVLHIIDSILAPPNKLKLPSPKSLDARLPRSVDELKERLAEYIRE